MGGFNDWQREAHEALRREISYPSGSRTIHQWRIRLGVQIPVDTKNYLDLKPGTVFPYNWLNT